MKFIVTGSLGNISKPLAQELVQKGHRVTVISSKPEKQKDIEAIGAIAEVVPLDQVLPRAQAIAKKPQMLTRFMSVTLRQRLSRRVAEGVQLGMALEGLAASDKAYQSIH